MCIEEPKPRSRNRQTTEDALIAAASRVFAERGYENATTRHIAEVAGYSEGLIQRYFNGKAGLLIATLRDRQQDAEKAAFFERPLCASLVDEVNENFAHAMANMGKRADAMRIVMSRVLVDPAFRADFSRLTVRPHLHKLMRARFDRYVAAGLIDSAIDVDAAVEMLMGLNFQLCFVRREMLHTAPAELRRIQARQAELFARAVAPAAGPAPPPASPDRPASAPRRRAPAARSPR